MRIKIDTSEYDELLLDIILQECGKVEEREFLIDTKCLSVYEDACNYLVEKGLLTTENGRIYKLKRKEAKE
jgi:hypothetical protein